LNPVIISKYRTVDWIFAVYKNIELVAIYLLTPSDLEPLFSRWEQRWHDMGGKDINNPKIPLDFVVKHGTLLHGTTPILKAAKGGEPAITIEGTPAPAVVVGEEETVEVSPTDNNAVA
jgi:hypothetical protein